MTRLQELQLRSSQIRSRLNEIGSMEGDLSDEIVAEEATLSKEYQQVEVKLRSLIASEDSTTEETSETPDDDRLELLQRSSVADVFSAALSGRAPQGATAELQAEAGVPSNHVPLELLTRAVSPAPTTGEPNTAEFVDPVFPMTVAEFLGVEMPEVPFGERTYQLLTTNLTANLPAGSADGDEAVAQWGTDILEPTRVQGAFRIRREDVARLGPGLEDQLRRNLNMVIDDRTDERILDLFFDATASGIAEPTALSGQAASDYAAFVALAADQVDGRYASMLSDVRLLFAPTGYSRAAQVFRGTDDAISALSHLNDLGVMTRAGFHMPTDASRNSEVLTARVMRGETHAVAPRWGGIELIVDNVTSARKGEIVVTAVLLMNVAVIHSDAYVREQIRQPA